MTPCSERASNRRVWKACRAAPGIVPQAFPAQRIGGRFLRSHQMDPMERIFVALTVVGSLGVVAIVIWMMMH